MRVEGGTHLLESWPRVWDWDRNLLPYSQIFCPVSRKLGKGFLHWFPNFGGWGVSVGTDEKEDKDSM